MKQKKLKNQKVNSKPTINDNIVAIDPSTSSTGICINGEMFSVVRETNSVVTKKGKYTKWYKIVDDEIDLISIPRRVKESTYSDEEISKLEMYRVLSMRVVDAITSNVSPHNTTVVIEGFSYNSAAGHLIDLVTFSTLIRNKLYNLGYELKIIAPTNLKLWTAKFCYDPIEEALNKKETRFKTVWRSPHSGNAGGKFTKTDMLNAIIDNDNLKDNWKQFLVEYYSDLKEMNKVPSPIEDLNDAYLLYNIHKNGYDE